MKNSILKFIVLLVLFGSCSVKEKGVNRSSDSAAIDSLAYFSAFTEATKQAILRNDKTAVRLFNECLKYNPSSAASYYQMSLIYLRNNNVLNAKELAKKSVELDSLNKWYNLNLSRLYQFNNQIDSSIIFQRKVVDIDPSVENKYNLVALLTSGGYHEEAITITDQLQEENKASKDLIVIRHDIYHKSQKYDSAIIELEKLISIFPDDYENYGLLAEYLTEIKRTNAAKKVYDELLNIEPDNGLVNISYAEFLYNNGAKDSAFIFYHKGLVSDDITDDDKMNILFNFISSNKNFIQDTIYLDHLLSVVKNNTKDIRIYTLYADYYIKVKRYEAAADELLEYLKYERKNFLIWEQLITIYSYIEDHNKVVSFSDSALIYFPEKVNIYLLKGYSLLYMSHYEKVIENSESGLRLNPTKEEKISLLNLLADANRELGRYHESNSYYEEILQIDPENLMIRNNYGYYLSIRNDNLDYALELSKLTIIKEPDNATYLDTYGWILFKKGNIKDAKKYVEKAIRSGAYQNYEVLDHYGDIMFQLNRCLEAIEAWEKAIEFGGDEDKIIDKINSARIGCP